MRERKARLVGPPCSERAGVVVSRRLAAQDIAAMLLEKGPMLKEYFGVGIVDSPEGPRLEQLPWLLDNYNPRVGGLPDFVLQLAWKVRRLCGITRYVGV